MDYGEPRRLVDMGIDAVEGCRTTSSAYRMMARGGENSWFNRWGALVRRCRLVSVTQALQSWGLQFDPDSKNSRQGSVGTGASCKDISRSECASACEEKVTVRGPCGAAMAAGWFSCLTPITVLRAALLVVRSVLYSSAVSTQGSTYTVVSLILALVSRLLL